MGITKSQEFSQRQNQMSALFKALGHPARLAILEMLLKTDSCICSDIVEELPLAQATISQHLRELKAAGLIKGNVEGNSVCYCIDEEMLHKVKEYLIKIDHKLQIKNCC